MNKPNPTKLNLTFEDEGEAYPTAVIRDKKGKRITSFDYDHQVDELVQWWRKIGERMRMTEDEVEKAYDAHWD